MKTKIVRYKISKKEYIGMLPEGAIVTNAELFITGDNADALILLPKKLTYIDEDGRFGTDMGCGCLSFAEKLSKNIWVKSSNDYINLSNTDYKKIKRL